MADPKPITLTQTDTNPGANEPQPMVMVGQLDVDTLDLTGVADYDAGETQTLKHVSGTLTWVTDV